MKQTLKIIAISALATTAVIKAIPVLADPAPVQNVSIVHTADLDLTTRAGRQTLDHRLVTAAYDVCGPTSDADLVGTNRARECRTEVLTSARVQSGQLAARSEPIRVAARR
jgi:UrcA family protein